RRMSVRSRACDWLLAALGGGFRRITRPAPVWWLAAICAPLGGALALAAPGLRRRAETNMALICPDSSTVERRRLVRAVGAEFMRLIVEYDHLDRFLPDLQVEIVGAAHLRAAREAGRGAVLVTAHYGNWEAARLAALRLGCETGIIYRAFNNRHVDRFALNLLPINGRPVLQKGRQGVRRMVRHVEGGGFILI